MRRRAGTYVGAIPLLVLALAQLPAHASPGAFHTAVGTGVEYTPAYCADTPCTPSTGATFAIDASDRPGSYGWMHLNAVSVALGCVTVEELTNGHAVYASGRGNDGSTYFAQVTSTGAVGSFIVSSWSGGLPCGANQFYGTSGYGTFVIAPTS